MSDLSELIKINRNIEAQNEEIIRLLKKIAGEDEMPEPVVLETEEEEKITFAVEELGPGEVYIVEGEDLFKLTIENNETSVDNLTGSAEINNFSEAETAVNAMIENGLEFEVPTVILDESVCTNLAKTLEFCVDIGAKRVYIPIKASIELLGAPTELGFLLEMEVYQNLDNLVEKVLQE